jgi:hypothetical protein
MKHRITQRCAHCKGEDVVVDAWAEWDQDKQEWVLRSVFEDYFCIDCEQACDIEELEIPDDDKPATDVLGFIGYLGDGVTDAFVNRPEDRTSVQLDGLPKHIFDRIDPVVWSDEQLELFRQQYEGKTNKEIDAEIEETLRKAGIDDC